MSGKRSRNNDECVLFAVLGMSPSVLTETVWALAGERDKRLPDRVVVLTTSEGRKKLARDLFDSGRGPGGWERLRQALKARGLDSAGRLQFGPAADHVRLFPAPSGAGDLADIATSADNLAAADFILRELRAFTENPATTVLASIAGGRKTMSALLMSCMSLLGREQDRVLHVLVNPPYDTPLDPPFLFPERNVKHRSRDGGGYRSDGACIDLIDVPFVRMRGWYEGAFKSAPPGYAALVSGVQRRAPSAAVRVKITLDRARGRLTIGDGTEIRLSAPEFAVLCLQLSGIWNHSDMAQCLLRLKQTHLPTGTPEWTRDFQESERFYDTEGGLVEHLVAIETLRRLLSSLRTKVQTVLGTSALSDLLPRREAESTYPRVYLSGPDPFADIRGYPESSPTP